MKKLSILTTPAIALGVGVLCAPQVLAVDYTLSQTNLDAAAAAPDTTVEGVFCADGLGFCTLSAGDWTQEGNINLGAVEVGGTPIDGLVLQNDVTISNPDGGTITGNIAITADEVTLNDLNVTGIVNVDNTDTEITINGGTYDNPDMMGALNVDNAKSVTINGGSFSTSDPNGTSAVYIGGYAYDPGTDTWTSTSGGNITITGGTFTSEFDHGIEFAKFDSLSISGGTFLGGAAGIAFGEAPAAGTVSLSGGTFTGTGANGRAITVGNTSDTAAISGMLADGYYFTNGTIEAEAGMGGGVYIAGTTTVTDGSDEDSSDSDSTSKSGLGAPDTGVFTAEGGSAEDNTAIIAILAVLAAAGLYLRRRVLR